MIHSSVAEVVNVARASGALGARMTGGGGPRLRRTRRKASKDYADAISKRAEPGSTFARCARSLA